MFLVKSCPGRTYTCRHSMASMQVGSRRSLSQRRGQGAGCTPGPGPRALELGGHDHHPSRLPMELQRAVTIHWDTCPQRQKPGQPLIGALGWPPSSAKPHWGHEAAGSAGAFEVLSDVRHCGDHGPSARDMVASQTRLWATFIIAALDGEASTKS